MIRANNARPGHLCQSRRIRLRVFLPCTSPATPSNRNFLDMKLFPGTLLLVEILQNIRDVGELVDFQHLCETSYHRFRAVVYNILTMHKYNDSDPISEKRYQFGAHCKPKSRTSR